jgi:hypothetical protein
MIDVIDSLYRRQASVLEQQPVVLLPPLFGSTAGKREKKRSRAGQPPPFPPELSVPRT